MYITQDCRTEVWHLPVSVLLHTINSKRVKISFWQQGFWLVSQPPYEMKGNVIIEMQQ